MEEIEQRWLYALSAPMVALNGASYSSPYYYHDGDDDQIDLASSWNVASREQLLDIVARMADDGHATELNAAYWRYQRALPSDWQALLEQLSLRERILHDYAARTFLDCGFGGTRAWDLGRMGFLLRCGLRNDWISFDESLWLQGRLAVRARHFYGSWSAYVAGYVIGRGLWGCSDLPDEQLGRQLERQGSDPRNQHIIASLSNDSASPFAELPWHLELNLPEKPASLAESDWS